VDSKDNYIDKLLGKWLAGTATDEEQEVIKQWAGGNEENLEVLETLQKVRDEKMGEPLLVNVDEKINEIWAKGMRSRHREKAVWKPIFKYAAAITLLVCTFWALVQLNNGGFDREAITVPEQPVYIFRENLAGQKTKLYMPDGSVAYLNSASSIKYLQGFSGIERRVELKGEAYFEVARNMEKPFIVESHGVETIALGTAFNLNAYSPEEELRVSLVEGKVMVHKRGNLADGVMLSPGRELHVGLGTDKLIETSFDPEEVIGWKDGKLIFKNAGFHEVKLRLERWFGVDIEIVGRVPGDWRLSTVYRGQTLKNILTDLQYSKDFAYGIEKEKVIIKF